MDPANSHSPSSSDTREALLSRAQHAERARAELAEQMAHVLRMLGFARGEIAQLKAQLAAQSSDAAGG